MEHPYIQNQNKDAFIAWVHRQRFRHVLAPIVGIEKPRVLEIGCAHGKLPEVLGDIDYTGLDIDPEFVRIAQERNPQGTFHVGDAQAVLSRLTGPYDAVYALETFEHLPYQSIGPVIREIARLAPRLVVSVPVEIGPAVWFKNAVSWLAGYHRHRDYSWSSALAAGLYRLGKFPRHDCRCHVGFDWRWLVHEIRQQFRIVSLRTLPLNLLPAALAVSVFIVAEPY